MSVRTDEVKPTEDHVFRRQLRQLRDALGMQVSHMGNGRIIVTIDALPGFMLSAANEAEVYDLLPDAILHWKSTMLPRLMVTIGPQ